MMTSAKLSDELSGLIAGIGRAFLFASYLPALLIIILNQYLLLPVVGVATDWLPIDSETTLISSELIATLLLPLFLGIMLVSWNPYITKFFEGALPWQRAFLWRRRQKANEEQSKSLYGQLRERRAKYRALLQTADPSNGQVPETHLDQIAQLEREIQHLHEQLESTQPDQTVPIRTHFVNATALGNAFAVFEEYPLDRYGIDGVLFWPRLRQVVDEKLLRVLDNLKMILDFQLNLALLSLIFTLEAILVGAQGGTAVWLYVAGVALFVAWLAYTAAIRIVRAIGVQVNLCFDLYRHKLLPEFGIKQPETFFDEYKTWLRLGAFLRRGELFYWPGDLYHVAGSTMTTHASGWQRLLNGFSILRR